MDFFMVNAAPLLSLLVVAFPWIVICFGVLEVRRLGREVLQLRKQVAEQNEFVSEVLADLEVAGKVKSRIKSAKTNAVAVDPKSL